MSSTCKFMMITDMLYSKTAHASYRTIGSIHFTPLNIKYNIRCRFLVEYQFWVQHFWQFWLLDLQLLSRRHT
jgi:hypothetical protein